MLNYSNIKYRLFLISFLIMFPAFIFSGMSKEQNRNKIRVAIVYNTSITGYHYKEGIINNLKQEIGNYTLDNRKTIFKGISWAG